MESSRRGLLRMSFAVVPAIFVRFQDSAAQSSSTRGKRPPTSPDDAANGENAANFPVGAANKAMLEERQKSIKKDVEKLYDLAAQLKDEVEKTDSTKTLSLAMVKKAEEIEKLAKQIKDHAKG